jgi:T-complex protein 1 subunit theta
MAKSMNLNTAQGLSGMLKKGHRTFEGLHGAVLQNIDACRSIANILKTSFGPNGLNKLVVNHLGKISVTSDCYAILQDLDIVHPAARVLLLNSNMQHDECGDASNFVITLAGELLNQAELLISEGLHPAEIISGYQRAYDRTIATLNDLVVREVEDLRDEQALTEAIRASLSSKQYGYEDVFAPLVARGCISVMQERPSGEVGFSVDSVRVSKMKGGVVEQSSLLQGLVIQRDTEGSIQRVEDAVVTVFACGIEASATEAKGTVILRNAEELKNYNKSEERKMEEIFRSIADSGCNVVICQGSVSELGLHFAEKYGILVVKTMSKFELRRICATVNATALVRLGPGTPEELGHCSLIEVREVGGRKVVVLEQRDEENRSQVVSVLVRASTDHVLNDLTRSVDGAIQTVKALTRSRKLVPGGGATEMDIAARMKLFAEEEAGSIEQYAIQKFGQAFEVFARMLATTSGYEAEPLISSLYAAHLEGLQRADLDEEAKQQALSQGVDVDQEGICDVRARHVYDCLYTKANALRLAVDAALTVLRVDQIVMSKQAGGPKPRDPPPPDA